MRKKVELIHQIRAMEAAPISRNKLVDFTETAGFRFLNEMSIAEVSRSVSQSAYPEPARLEPAHPLPVCSEPARLHLILS